MKHKNNDKNLECVAPFYGWRPSAGDAELNKVNTPLLPLFFQKPDPIYFPHQPIGLGKGHDYFLVVQDIGKLQFAALAVLEPFLGGLVTANVKFPRHSRHIVKILGIVDVNFTFFVVTLSGVEAWFAHHIIAIYRILRNVLLHFWTFQ